MKYPGYEINVARIKSIINKYSSYPGYEINVARSKSIINKYSSYKEISLINYYTHIH